MILIRKPAVIDSLKYLLFLSIIVFLLFLSSSGMSYKWQWYRVPGYIISHGPDGRIIPGRLLVGLGMTVRISAVSLVLSMIIGTVTALFRMSASIVARILARVYLELVRNTPLLIQLFLMYFVISPVLNMSPFVSAVLALSLFEGAYASEIIRGGITAIPMGQWESSYSLGLNTFDTYRFVILPQTLKQILPPLTSQAVSLIKDSALVSTIAIYDLTMAGQAIVSRTFLSFEIWFTVAAIYLVMTVSISTFVHHLEKRSSYGK